MDKKEKKPQIRFIGFNDPWEQRKWLDTVDISTKMVDPKCGKYDDLPHIAPGNIESFSGRVFDNVKMVKDENLISGKFCFYAGDIIYGKINPQLGKYTLAKFKGLTSADAYVLNSKNGLSQKFLFTLIQTQDFYKYTVSVSRRSGMPKINRNELNSFNYKSPCEPEQKKIGGLLLSIDNLITLHQRKLEKLKIIKKSLLTKMFPENNNIIPKVRFSGFTEPWEQRKFENIFDLSQGLQIDISKRFKKPGEKLYFYITNEFLKPNSKEKYYIYNPHSNVICSKEDILMTRTGNTGIVLTDIEGCFHNNFFKIKYDNCEFNKYFLVYFFQHPIMKHTILINAGSSTIPDLSHKSFNMITSKFPLINEQTKIGQLNKQIDNLITLHQRQLDKLKNIKKSMLDKMFV